MSAVSIEGCRHKNTMESICILCLIIQAVFACRHTFQTGSAPTKSAVNIHRGILTRYKLYWPEFCLALISPFGAVKILSFSSSSSLISSLYDSTVLPLRLGLPLWTSSGLIFSTLNGLQDPKTAETKHRTDLNSTKISCPFVQTMTFKEVSSRNYLCNGKISKRMQDGGSTIPIPQCLFPPQSLTQNGIWTQGQRIPRRETAQSTLALRPFK